MGIRGNCFVFGKINAYFPHFAWVGYDTTNGAMTPTMTRRYCCRLLGQFLWYRNTSWELLFCLIPTETLHTVRKCAELKSSWPLVGRSRHTRHRQQRAILEQEGEKSVWVLVAIWISGPLHKLPHCFETCSWVRKSGDPPREQVWKN